MSWMSSPVGTGLDNSFPVPFDSNENIIQVLNTGNDMNMLITVFLIGILLIVIFE